MARSGLTYYGFVSFDGASWSPIGSYSPSSAHNNLWLLVANKAAGGSPVPIQAFDWIRLGSNAVDPW
jgi:hypothetical protein